MELLAVILKSLGVGAIVAGLVAWVAGAVCCFRLSRLRLSQWKSGRGDAPWRSDVLPQAALRDALGGGLRRRIWTWTWMLVSVAALAAAAGLAWLADLAAAHA